MSGKKSGKNQWLPAAPGTLLADKYLLEGVLGVGGMGVVMRARSVALGAPVAIKFVKGDRGQRFAERLHREAAAAARIQHPNVVRVFEWGQLDEQTPFLVMELLQGQSFAQYLEQHGPMSVDQTCHWLIQVCSGLAAAHALGIVHRDLTPGNLFLAEPAPGVVIAKVLDFGLAKSLRDDPGGQTTHGQMVLGSPAYMSPEQIRYRDRLDARTDLWSLAVVTQQLLTGKLPFPGRSHGDTLARVLSDIPEPIGPEVNIPDPLRLAIARCLRKDPNERLHNVGLFQQALIAACGANISSLPAPSSGSAAALSPGEATLPHGTEQVAPWRRR